MASGRNQACPCGSGRKFKHCCGSVGNPASSSVSAAAALDDASRLLQGGQLAQAEARYRQILARESGNEQATHFLGICLFQAGRGDEALALLRRSIALAPSNDMFWLNVGMVLTQLNQLEEAGASFRHVIALRPDSPAGHNYLGVALLRLGRYAQAVASFERALALNPADDTIHNNFGLARLEHGEVETACRQFRRAVEINPNNATAHNNLGNALRALGDPAGSIASYRRAVEVDPGLAMARFNLGRALVDAGQPDAALEHLRAAVRFSPQEGAAWQWLADVLTQFRVEVYDGQMESEILACLARPDIEPAYLAQTAASLLRAEPSFGPVLRASAGGDSRPLQLDRAVLRRIARPVFLLLLENAIVPEADFERLIAGVRRAAMLAWKERGLDADPVLREVLAAIAHQCFLTEYLHEECDDESPIVLELGARLAARLAAAEPVNEAELALYACYRPLGTLAGADALPAQDATLMGRLALRQVREPQEESAIVAALPRLTPVSDEVSRAVQAQYEQHPYPRWLRAPSTGGAYPHALRLRMLFPHAKAAGVLPERPSILIAGCGTGRHVAITASLNPDSRILAIDLSLASLAYAARRARQGGLRNVEFAQADILEIGRLEERFDVIECSGVLHHLGDPLAGWRALAGLLASGGKMKVGLYSEIARRGVVAARRLIAGRQYPADRTGMRAARAAILALAPEDTARAVAASIDFYSLSGCRDLLFHAQEHRYTLDGLAAAIGDLGLDFMGFEFEYATTHLQYRREFPLDPAATSLSNWAEFEARHPDTFAGMYQFWLARKG